MSFAAKPFLMLSSLFLAATVIVNCTASADGSDEQEPTDDGGMIDTGDASGAKSDSATDAKPNQQDAGPATDSGPTTSCEPLHTGSTFNRGTDAIAKCNAFPPTNCRTGNFIWFDDSKKLDTCLCALDCQADFNPPKSPGASCDTNGKFTCTQVKSSTGSTRSYCMDDFMRSQNVCKP